MERGRLTPLLREGWREGGRDVRASSSALTNNVHVATSVVAPRLTSLPGSSTKKAQTMNVKVIQATIKWLRVVGASSVTSDKPLWISSTPLRTFTTFAVLCRRGGAPTMSWSLRTVLKLKTVREPKVYTHIRMHWRGCFFVTVLCN